METIQDLKVHLTIQRFFGLAPFTIDENKKLVTRFGLNFFLVVNVATSTFITILSYILAKSAANVINTGEIANDGQNMIQISDISEYIQRIFAITTYVVILVSAVLKKYQHMELLSSILESDALILGNFNSEYTHILSEKVHVYLHVVLFIYVSLASVINFANLLLINNDVQDVIRVGIYAALTLTTYLFSFHYNLMCSLITKRFKLVELYCAKKLNQNQFFKILELNKNLRNCLSHLNECQGFPLFLNLTSDTILTTIQLFLTLYTIFLPEGSGFLRDNIVQTTCWTVPLIAKMLIVIFAGENLKNQIADTNKAIGDNYHRRFNGKETEILLGCPMDKLYGEELACTAAEFFVVDFTLIYHIVASLTTYLVILLQFQVDAGDEEE